MAQVHDLEAQILAERSGAPGDRERPPPPAGAPSAPNADPRRHSPSAAERLAELSGAGPA